MKITLASSAALIVFAGLQFATALPAAAPEPQTDAGTPQIFARQATSPDGSCGAPNNYRCATNVCCSQWGWCGTSDGHCGTGCQAAFGKCNGVTPPPTTTSRPPTTTTTRPPTTTTTRPPTTTTSRPPTTTTATPPPGGRPRLGNVPYGVTLYGCTVAGTAAMTFDDGPYIYTQDLLNLLSSRSVKATFFVNGANWGEPITSSASQAQLIRNAYNAGHQIASHTWSHPDLSTLDAAGIRSQMNQLESALLNIMGRYPTYMRPPYLSCGSTCLSTLNTLGYHIISTNLDTNDWQEDMGYSQSVVNSQLSSGSLILDHDVHAPTVYTLATYIMDRARERGIRLVTVGECLGDPVANWYRTTL